MTLAAVEVRIGNLHVVRDIVSTMRSLSAVHFRRGAAALDTLREYESSMREALALIPAPALTPRAPDRVQLIVLGSDQGMCGPLTRRLVDRAAERAETLGSRLAEVVAVGSRTADLLSSHGHQVHAELRSAVSLRGVDRLVERLARVIEGTVALGRSDGVEVVYTRHEGMAAGTPAVTRVFPVHRQRLLPRDRPTPAIPPQTLEPPADVAAALLSQWTLVEVYRAAIESLTAEHAARLRTTDAATHTLERRLDALRLERNHLRQESITQELQEIVAGARVVRARGQRDSAGPRRS